MNIIKISKTLFILSAFLLILALISLAVLGLYPGVNESFGLVPFVILTLGGPASVVGMVVFGFLWSVFASKKS